MSKRKGHRKKRRRKNRPVVCPRCHAPADPSAASALSAVAAILNACEAAGIPVRLRHGVVQTREGYVLPLAGGRWTARTLAYDPLSPADDEDD